MKVSVDKCPAGPEMDTAVAKARGWKKVECDGLWYWADPTVDEWHTNRVADSKNVHGYELEDTHVWSPSTGIADAHDLIENRKRHDFTDAYAISMNYVFDGDTGGADWVVEFASSSDSTFKSADDMAPELPHAISRAYLRARGIEYVEVDQ